MKHVIAPFAVLMLVGCTADSGVMQIGPGRYRITMESMGTVADAEASVIQRANQHCAALGRTADLNMTNSRPYQPYSHYSGASAEFTCVAPR